MPSRLDRYFFLFCLVRQTHLQTLAAATDGGQSCKNHRADEDEKGLRIKEPMKTEKGLRIKKPIKSKKGLRMTEPMKTEKGLN